MGINIREIIVPGVGETQQTSNDKDVIEISFRQFRKSTDLLATECCKLDVEDLSSRLVCEEIG